MKGTFVFFAVYILACVSAQSDDSLVFSGEQQAALKYLREVDIKAEMTDRELTLFRIDCFLKDEKLNQTDCQKDIAVKHLQALLPLLTDDLCRSCTRLERSKSITLSQILKKNYTGQYYDLLKKYNNCQEEPELVALIPDILPPRGYSCS